MKESKDLRLVFVTFESYENAMQVARILINEKIAACCTVLPNATSVYGWQGQVQERKELQMLIKTSKSNIDNLEKRVVELHQDDTPEFLVVNPESGSNPYVDWIMETLK